MDVFITNDTGPMHLAAAVGTKTVCIFGPGDHWRFAPSVPGSRFRIVRKALPGCVVPCYKFSCGGPRCLSGISPEEVLAAASELLGAGAAKKEAGL
jgi:ADP-heptose:LPS heptosyltransferase